MEIQPQTAAADHRPNGDMAQNIQQLNQAGFDEAQIWALVALVGDAVRNAALPVMEHVDWRFDAADQRFGDFRKHVGQRFDDSGKYVDQRFGASEKRIGRLERRTDDGMRRYPGEAERSFVMPKSGGARMQPQEWAFVVILVLGFTGIALALALTV